MARLHPPAPAYISSQVAEARRFYLEAQPPAKNGITVTCGGWERCAPDYRVSRQQFPSIAVELVVAGQGQLEINGRIHPLSRGSVFTYGPDIPHTITTHPEEPLSKYFINFTGKRASDLLAISGMAAGAFQAVSAVDDVQAAYEQLIITGRRHLKEVHRISALLLEILLLRVSEARIAGPGRSQQAFATFDRCRAYLEQHWLQLQTAEEAAKACHIDPAYFSRLFTRFTGEAPYRFLLRLKMNHAATLMEANRLPVRQTAAFFEMDPFHFSRVFKRVHGLSPRSFLHTRQTPTTPAPF